jgi:peptidoglycan/xylan/chitin deacetylase (PgdA/CDA1 family)
MKKLTVLLLAVLLLWGCAAAPAVTTTPETTIPETTVPETTQPDVQRELYVLMYHSVAPDGTECNAWTITESTFRAHMQYIADRGYTVVAPSDLVSGEPLPEKGVMITFDDGYADNFTAALPILEEFDYKAVVALITSCMETSDGAFWMDWQMSRQAAQGGTLELGVHTHATHKYPGIQRWEGESREEYRQRLSADLDTAIALIQEKAGMTPIYFAYPQGIKDEWATDLIDGRFQVTGTSFIGVNDPDNGTHDLMRYNVGESTDLTAILP